MPRPPATLERPHAREPLALFLRRALRGKDNRVLDIAIGVANGVGRSLLVYVEPPTGPEPGWVAELVDSLIQRSVGLRLGIAETRDESLRATGASAVLYEAPDVFDSSLRTMALETKSVEELVAGDTIPTPFWQKVSRAADLALPVAALLPTLWVPFAVPSERRQRAAGAHAEESPNAADELLRVVCEGALTDRTALEGVAKAIAAGMLAVERAVQSIVTTSASRTVQEDALLVICPPLRALRSMP